MGTITGRKLERADIPEIERIAGLFPRGFISIVASMAGTGKTWLTQYLACQLSIGGEICGGLATNTAPKKCVIFSGETGSDLLILRLNKSAWKVNSHNVSIYNAIEMATNKTPLWLNDEAGQRNVTEIMNVEQPDIVWFDTLISFHTADESKQGEMTSLYVWLARMARFYKCAVVCNHHTRKRPASDAKRKFTQEDVIGSSVGVRLASSVYVISSEDKPGGGFVNTVDNVKAWDRKVPPFSYEFINTPGGIDFAINLNIKPELSVPGRFFEWITQLAAGALFTVNDVASVCKISRPIAQDTIDKYIEYGSIERVSMMTREHGSVYYQLVRMLPVNPL